MNDVLRMFVVLFALLMGRARGIQPKSGYCILNQCFTVFQDPSDYTAARAECEAAGGHLMTVRSSVSNDVFSVLLGNSAGRFWIGLHLETGCPDAAAELKGFQWVTGDTESDFFNWAPSFDSDCSSHRCISVSKEDDFKWTQEPCSDHAAGFLCEYSFKDPCKSLTVADNESVRYTVPLGFEGEDMLSLPPGSTAIRMPGETKYVCFSEQWLQAPWSCEIHEGGCEYKCAVDPKQVPSCYCPQGQSVNPANKVTCEVAIEDPCLALNCEQACYKSGESYSCMCDHGFKLAQDGRSCIDFNDCRDERQCPGDNFKCINTVGGFKCVCEDGYELSGDACVDVNECRSAPCEHMCHNTPGNYTCSCYEDYKVDPMSPDKCKLHCGKVECPAVCDPNDNFQCYCPDGYISEERGNQVFCIDINECMSFYCDQDCVNTFGGYECSCKAGFTLVDENKCVKDFVDEEESSGATTTSDTPTTPPVQDPDPTRQPSAVTVGGLVGIIVCTVFFIVLVVFLAHHILSGRGKMESAAALKAAEGEDHSLERVTSDS